MTTDEHFFPAQPALQPGDHVRVQHLRGVPYRAVVDDCLPALNVLWVRDMSTGERKMVSGDEHTINRR